MIVFALILFMALIVYFPAFQFGFVLDDYPIIIENPVTRHLDFKALWRFDPSRFLTNTSFALNYFFGRFRMSDWHSVNVLLHALNSFMLFKLVELTAQSPRGRSSCGEGKPFLYALAAALLFCLHPVNTQTVNYMVQRATLLVSLFILAGLFFYVRARLSEKRIYYLYSVMLIIFGTVSKPQMIIFPGLLLLYEICFFGLGERITRHRACVWSIVLLPVFITVALLLRGGEAGRLISFGMYNIPYGQRLLTQPSVAATFLRLTLFPAELNFDYDFPLVTGIFQISNILSLVLIGVLLTVAQRAFSRSPALSFGIFFFFTALLPVALFPLTDVIFEHWVYLSSVGVIIAVLEVVRRLRFRTSLIVLCAILAAFAALTLRRNGVWKNSLTLLEDNVRKSPGKYRVRTNLGALLLESGHLSDARREFMAAVEIDPSKDTAYSNLARTYIETGEYEKAQRLLQRALLANPMSQEALINLAQVYEHSGRVDAAYQAYQLAIERNPNFSAAYVGLGNLFQNEGHLLWAKETYQRAAWLKPENPVVYYNLGNVFFKERSFYEALMNYQKAIDLKPDFAEAHVNLGNVYYYFGDYKNAIEKYEDALKFDDMLAEAYFNMANALRALGFVERAEEAIHKAVTFYRAQGEEAAARRIETIIGAENHVGKE